MAAFASTSLIAEPGPSYFCTWATQGSTLKGKTSLDPAYYAGDLTISPQRDNLNEEVLFGENGWAKVYYPNARKDLFFLLDAGWDLPYKSRSDWRGIRLRGSFIPSPDRFPSFKGTPAERLRQLTDKLKSLGWRGLGVWVPPHVFGDTPGHDGIPAKFLNESELRRVLTEKMKLCRDGGVAYWKVDWGLRTHDVKFRKLMCEIRDQIYPELIIEHCWVPGTAEGALNGVKFEKNGSVSGCGRYLGNAEWEKKRADQLEIMSVSDTWRTYDEIFPFSLVSTLERCAYYSTMADERHLPVVLNVEGVARIAAGLGHAMGVMQSGMWQGKPVENDACLALKWQRLAPPFGHDTALVTRYSKQSLTDEWTYNNKDCSWVLKAAGKRVTQTAPAIVVRGMELPEVSVSGIAPFVCAAKYPNGAVSLSLLPRALGGKTNVGDATEVKLPVTLEAGTPLFIWGFEQAVKTVTFKCKNNRRMRVTAENLISGECRDITASCIFGEDGSITVRGKHALTATGGGLKHAVIRVAPQLVVCL